MLGFRYFSEREAEILYKRVMIDDPSKAHSKRSVSWPELRSAVRVGLPNPGVTDSWLT